MIRKTEFCPGNFSNADKLDSHCDKAEPAYADPIQASRRDEAATRERNSEHASLSREMVCPSARATTSKSIRYTYRAGAREGLQTPER